MRRYAASHMVTCQAVKLEDVLGLTKQLHLYTSSSTMSSNPVSESNLGSLFDAALKEYEKQAGTKLLGNRLIIQLQSCDSADAISTVLQKQAQAFHTFRGGDGKLTSWLKRTVHVLYTLSTSSALGAGVGLVRCELLVRLSNPLMALTRIQPFPPANAIFAGIGILLTVCRSIDLTVRPLR